MRLELEHLRLETELAGVGVDRLRLDPTRYALILGHDLGRRELAGVHTLHEGVENRLGAGN